MSITVLSLLLACSRSGGEMSGTSGSTSSTGAETTTPTATVGSGTAAATGETQPDPEVLSVEFVEIAWPAEAPREITEMRFLPGSNELLLLSKPGVVHHYALEGDALVGRGSFSLDDIFSNNDCGLLSIAFDPDFENNRLFYVGACVDHDHSAVYRLEWNPSDYGAVVASRVPIIVEGDTDAEWPWHNVGSIGFFSDESMWVGFGDKTVTANGQDKSNNLAAMLRILPDRDPRGQGGYQPAEGNPFSENPDLWAYGLRVPFRTAIDDRDRLIVAEVGAVSWEEVNLIDGPGLNFGWPVAEGPCQRDCAGLTEPAISWSHTVNDYAADDPLAVPTSRRVAWVSPFYDPPAGLDRYAGLMTGRVLFGDMCVGWVRGLEFDARGSVVYDAHAGHLENAAAWSLGPDGYVYAVASGGCVNVEFGAAPATMYRVVQAEPT
jgi:glucose/arabinose dehydrogenase